MLVNNSIDSITGPAQVNINVKKHLNNSLVLWKCEVKPHMSTKGMALCWEAAPNPSCLGLLRSLQNFHKGINFVTDNDQLRSIIFVSAI